MKYFLSAVLGLGLYGCKTTHVPQSPNWSGDLCEALEAKVRAAERRIRSLEAQVYPGFKENKEYLCDSILEQVQLAIDEYWSEKGAYPPSGNSSLVRELSKKNRDNLPYLQFKAGMLNESGELLDPWRVPFVYQYNAKTGVQGGKVRKPEYQLYSCGKNGEDDQGKGDDLPAW